MLVKILETKLFEFCYLKQFFSTLGRSCSSVIDSEDRQVEKLESISIKLNTYDFSNILTIKKFF